MKNVLFFALFCASISPLFAQKGSIKVSIDRDSVALNEYFILSVAMQNCDANSFKMPPEIDENFTLAGRPTTQTSMSIVNGAMSSSANYTYYLTPKKSGKITIDNITVKGNDGKVLNAEKHTITVLKAGKTAPKSNNQPQLRNNQPHIQQTPDDYNDPFSRKPKRKTIQI